MRRRGFTLIELLVALTILAIILSTVYATFFSALRAMRESRSRDDTFQVARVVMEQISNDLAAAFFRSDPGRKDQPTSIFLGKDASDGDFARDRLDFTSANHPLFRDGRPESDVAEISYYIDDTYRNQPLLVRREDPLPDHDLRHGGTLRVLAQNVVALNFRYRERGPEANERIRGQNEPAEPAWFDTWDAEKAEGYASLPELVEVTVTIRDEQGELHPFGTTVLLHPYQVWRRPQ
jgi:prepilin-type N-terminal cleavage/methylation domain-containing protein